MFLTALRLLPISFVLILTACSPAFNPAKTSAVSEIGWLNHVDQVVSTAGCRDGSYFSPVGYPHLRISRFWQSFARQPLTALQFEDWLGVLRDNDRRLRQVELACLDPESLERLAAQVAHPQNTLPESVEKSAEALRLNNLRNQDTVLQEIKEQPVPDDYSIFLRTAGLYPLSRIPVSIGVKLAYDERRLWFQKDLESLVDPDRIVEIGPSAYPPVLEPRIADLIAATRQNPLAVPRPNPQQARQLAEFYAPVFRQEEKLPIDRWGAVSTGGQDVRISGERTVYYYLDHLRYNGTPHLRINYVNWYPERSGEAVPWYEEGHLDGVTYGIVVNDRGEPLMAMTMNNCGCYLQMYPAQHLRAVTRDKTFSPDALAPQRLPPFDPQARIAMTISSGWHQVLRLEHVREAPPLSYALQPYEVLEQLPTDTGRANSLFNADGVVNDTGRIEVIFFFGMGIPDVGSMRQRGRQPVTLIGREHYDDPDLIDRNFVFPAGD